MLDLRDLSKHVATNIAPIFLGDKVVGWREVSKQWQYDGKGQVMFRRPVVLTSGGETVHVNGDLVFCFGRGD